MENFNEYKQKNTSTRVKITYVRDSNNRLNPWEITHFIGRITTYMYKIEVLNTIAMAINNGIEKKNIFVLDRAYRLNKNYTGYAELDLNAGALNRLYSMGSPEGMEPNQDLIELRLLFELLYDVSQILRSYGAWRISYWEQMGAYNCLMERGFLAAVEYIKQLAERRLQDRSNIARIKKAVDGLTSKCEKVTGEYKQYFSDREYFGAIEDKLNAKTDRKLSTDEEQIVDRYYKKFYQIITDSVRPIVGIYDAEHCVMRILCADHFDESLNKNTRIDLKSITQNSPILGEIEAGCQILALREEEKRKKKLFELERENMLLEQKNALLKEKNLKLEQENLLLERKKWQEELRVISLEKEQKQIETVNSALETLRRIDELADDEEIRGIKALAASYAKEQIGSIYVKVQKGYADALYKNGFRVKEMQIIDVKV